MTKYITVVYAIEDEKQFAPILKEMKLQMLDREVTQSSPNRVCALSMNHEIQRLEMLEDALSDSDARTAQYTALDILFKADLPDIERKCIFLA
ncbi:hypothetical protein DDN60_15490 [Vibrio cholerae]|nr:hypothetical protein [Vibrio cholerae]